MEKKLSPLTGSIHGEVYVPGDKSISHRAVMFGSFAQGKTTITNFLPGEDCLSTIEIFKQMGVQIDVSGDNKVEINSNGRDAFTEPLVPLYFGNSGTTARLMLGILASLPFHTVVYGDPHLTERPMDRVVNPLRKMGAKIDGRHNGSMLPLAIKGTELSSINYVMPVKSAQVKSAILLAGLFADGKTVVTENGVSRDHTENMLQSFGAKINKHGKDISIEKSPSFQANNIEVPGDISSAAFLLVAGAIVPGSILTLKNVGMNETRTGILNVLKFMGAKLEIANRNNINGEISGDITIKYNQLQSITIDGDIIPTLIDEIPIIALLATQAEGTTIIKDAEELRVKETDRIKAVCSTLSTLGANVEEMEDGIKIHGKTSLHGGEIKGYSDHRMAMMGVIASMVADGDVIIDDISSIAVSYPNFFRDIENITK